MLHGGGPKYITRRGCLNILLENGEGGKYIARRGVLNILHRGGS